MYSYNYQNYYEDPYDEEFQEDNYYDDEDEDYYDYEDDDYYPNDYYDDDQYYDNDYDMDYDYENSIQNIYRFDNKKSFTEIINSEINPNPMSYIPQSHLNILMIAEKPSIARTISKILCTNKYKNTYQDLSSQYGWCYYTFNGKFKGIEASFTVSSVAGHLYENDFLRIHQNNQDMDPGE